MTNISVIILAGREELHIRRCLEKLAPLAPRQVFVVESQRGDRTHEIAVETAKALGWSEATFTASHNHEIKQSNNHTVLSLVWHDWPGNQARQFNWALENLPIAGAWVLRLDADEYLTSETIERLRSRNVVDNGVMGLTLELRRRFCGGEIRHGTAGIRQARLFRRGKARYSDGLMDERLSVDGEVMDFEGAFYDDSLMPMSEWRAKHRAYAKREAEQAIEGLKTGVWTDSRKATYYRLPPYFRAFAYFCIRYFLKGGILDGYAGWMWNFWQGLWYRLLVDREISRLNSEGQSTK